MKTVCAWCGALIKDGPPNSEGRVSEGICQPCVTRELDLVDVCIPEPFPISETPNPRPHHEYDCAH